MLSCRIVEDFSRDHLICSHRGIQIKEVQISESLLYFVLLTRFKHCGGLYVVSADVFWVVAETERQCTPFLHNSEAYSMPCIVTKMKNLVLFKCKFSSHCTNEDFVVPHYSILI